MRRFFSASLGPVGSEQLLAAVVSHHLLRVTGIRPGEMVELFDGQGLCVRASLVAVEDGCARVQLREAIDSTEASRPVWLFQAQLRAGGLDTVIRMATELGVERIIPVRTQRTVARGEKPERWTRIATAAAAQSGRARVPQVSAPIPFEAALEAAPKSMSWWIAIPGAAPVPAATGPVAVLVGPEGGWTEQECTAACSAGWTPIGLGQGILRADTAAVVALSSALGDR